MKGSTAARACESIGRLSNQGLDLPTFWRRSEEVIARVVPHSMAPCWFTLDPGSLLVTSHFQPELPELPVEWLAHEYFGDDVHKMADIARSDRGISTLHEATGGDLSRSQGYVLYMKPFGAEQELLVALRTRTGDAWGMLGLYREPGDPLFTPDEQRFLCDVALHLAEGARRGLLVGEATDPEGPESPGLVVLRDDWSIESLTPGVERWLAALPGRWEARGDLPPAVLAVAGQALRGAGDPGVPADVVLSRVLSQDGRWIVLHGMPMTSDGRRRVGIMIESAHPARIVSLLMAAYGLTEREQDVTRLVLQGNSTAEIAVHIQVSPQTVQQHLKNIFAKTGVRSRRELVGTVFFAFYEPRLRDNEHRVLASRPVRGGPLARVNDDPPGR